MDTENDDIETTNDFLVGTCGDEITIMRPPFLLTKTEALRFAAWLVALAEEDDGEFATVLEAVRST